MKDFEFGGNLVQSFSAINLVYAKLLSFYLLICKGIWNIKL